MRNADLKQLSRLETYDILLFNGNKYSKFGCYFHGNDMVLSVCFINIKTGLIHEFFINHICEKDDEGYYKIIN